MDTQAFFSELETTTEPIVREKLAAGRYNSSRVPVIKEWLRQQEEARAAVVTSKREAREEATLSTAKEANLIAADAAASARRSSRWAMDAAIIPVIAAAISGKDHILSIVFP